jgi:Fe-S-cluster containining protein
LYPMRQLLPGSAPNFQRRGSRPAGALAITPQQFIDSYLERSEPYSNNPWTTRTTPCPFLKENRCSVYDERPADCSGYPYLYEPEFVFRTMGMIGRTFTCPIVYEVMEELKKIFGLFKALQIKGKAKAKVLKERPHQFRFRIKSRRHICPLRARCPKVSNQDGGLGLRHREVLK